MIELHNVWIHHSTKWSLAPGKERKQLSGAICIQNNDNGNIKDEFKTGKRWWPQYPIH